MQRVEKGKVYDLGVPLDQFSYKFAGHSQLTAAHISARKAAMGSIRDARRAGSHAASRATAARADETAA